jgi:Putative MetA-pathway of phenol degradation
MQTTAAVLMVVLTFLAVPPLVEAERKLIDLLPGLYGGDGITLATAPTASHAAHFTIGSAASINRLNQQIASEVGVFPFASSVGGFTFAFDPLLGTFNRTTESLGPLFAERGPTLGRGKLNFGLYFTHFQYDTFDGEDLDRLQVDARHEPDIIGFPDTREQFEQDIVRIRVDLNLRISILSLAATYGVTDRLDLGILLPFVHVDMRVKSQARVIQAPENTLFPGVHTFENGPENPRDTASDSATGLGDVVLRAKYYLLSSTIVDLAGALLVKLATGDHDNFLGTGDTTIRPFLVLSRTWRNVVLPQLALTPHLNLGYEFNLDHSDRNALEYVVGFDLGNGRVTLAGEFFGSHELDGDGIGDNILTASVGVKWNPWQRLLLAANTQFPLNDEGLRSNLILTFGVEYSF